MKIKTVLWGLATAALLVSCSGAKLSVANEQYARGEFYATDVITDYAIDFAARRANCINRSSCTWHTTPRISRCKPPANASITTWKSI